MDSEATGSQGMVATNIVMKAINGRLQRLEQRYMPQRRDAGPSPADVLRARYRRRMEASGEPCVPLPTRNDVAGKSIAEVLRSRFCRV